MNPFHQYQYFLSRFCSVDKSYVAKIDVFENVESMKLIYNQSHEWWLNYVFLQSKITPSFNINKSLLIPSITIFTCG